MGQVFSYIWRCIPCLNIEADTTPLNDQYASVEEQGYYYITYMAEQDDDDDDDDEYELDEEDEEEEEVVEKVIQVQEQEELVRQVLAFLHGAVRIGPYSSIQGILLVGEGDFSFSASLAVAFGSAPYMFAASLNSLEFLTKHYPKFPTNNKELESRGCTVIHGVDATNMLQHPALWNLIFDRIIFNFPHSPSFAKTHANMLKNQNLVGGFIRNAKKMLNEDGEIHIRHKTSYWYRKWDIPKIGCDEGLHLIEETMFNRNIYRGYRTICGFRSDRYFDCNPSKTYKFGLRPKSI